MALVTTESASIVIGCAIKVHRTLGPGLFESVYEPCLAHEMTLAGLHFERQVPLPVTYGDITFPRAFRPDFVIENELIVELKCVEQLLPVHHAQVLTYVKLARLRKGLLINFNSPLLKQGIRSIVV